MLAAWDETSSFLYVVACMDENACIRVVQSFTIRSRLPMPRITNDYVQISSIHNTVNTTCVCNGVCKCGPARTMHSKELQAHRKVVKWLPDIAPSYSSNSTRKVSNANNSLTQVRRSSQRRASNTKQKRVTKLDVE